MGCDRLLELGTEVYGRCQQWSARGVANVRGISVRFSLPSLGASVRSKLRSAIALCPGMVEATDVLPPIPLTLDRRGSAVRYRCAIAQRLGAITGQSPWAIAMAIATVWQTDGDLAGRSLAELTVRSDGRLDLELTDRAIGLWLAAVSGDEAGLGDSGLAVRSDVVFSFAVYHAFARCRSLVAAAAAEGWFDRELLASLWCDQAGCLRLGLAAERRAIVGLAWVFDGLCCLGGGVGSVRFADCLAADFEGLARHSRAWSALRMNDRAMAIVRVGLLRVYVYGFGICLDFV